MIKIIKRKATPELPTPGARKRATATATVRDWIAESRQKRLDRDSSSRKTIAGWAAESII